MTNKEVMVWLEKIMKWDQIPLCCIWYAHSHAAHGNEGMANDVQ